MVQWGNLPPPGFYPDPERPDVQRWWDGNAWATQVVVPPQRHRKPFYRRWLFWVPAVIVLLLLAGFIEGFSSDSPSRTVVFYLDGTAQSADLTITADTGGTSQVQSVPIPLADQKTGKEGLTIKARPGAFLYISAQIDEDGGSLTCKIVDNGKVIAENVASGEFAIASCSGEA